MLDQRRVELRAGTPSQFGDGGIVRNGGTVAAMRGHRVVGIRNGQQASAKRIQLARRQFFTVSNPFVPGVMVSDDGRELRTIESGLDDFHAYAVVFAHQPPFVFG